MVKQCKDCRFWFKVGRTKSGGRMTCNFNDDIPDHIPESQKERYIENYLKKTREEVCNLFLPEENEKTY